MEYMNPYKGAKYNDINNTLRLPGNATMKMLLTESEAHVAKLAQTLKSQNDPSYLTKHNLPKLPKTVDGPKIQGSPLVRTPGKYAQAGIIHSKKTNGGYCRTNYGGFYMH